MARRAPRRHRAAPQCDAVRLAPCAPLLHREPGVEWRRQTPPNPALRPAMQHRTGAMAGSPAKNGTSKTTTTSTASTRSMSWASVTRTQPGTPRLSLRAPSESAGCPTPAPGAYSPTSRSRLTSTCLDSGPKTRAPECEQAPCVMVPPTTMRISSPTTMRTEPLSDRTSAPMTPPGPCRAAVASARASPRISEHAHARSDDSDAPSSNLPTPSGRRRAPTVLTTVGTVLSTATLACSWPQLTDGAPPDHSHRGVQCIMPYGLAATGLNPGHCERSRPTGSGGLTSANATPRDNSGLDVHRRPHRPASTTGQRPVWYCPGECRWDTCEQRPHGHMELCLYRQSARGATGGVGHVRIGAPATAAGAARSRAAASAASTPRTAPRNAHSAPPPGTTRPLRD